LTINSPNRTFLLITQKIPDNTSRGIGDKRGAAEEKKGFSTPTIKKTMKSPHVGSSSI
jgi:hypothetical protein